MPLRRPERERRDHCRSHHLVHAGEVPGRFFFSLFSLKNPGGHDYLLLQLAAAGARDMNVSVICTQVVEFRGRAIILCMYIHM